MRRKTIVLAAVMAFAPVAAARAQACMGGADLSPMSAGAQLGLDDSNSLIGTFGMSTRTNWFGAVGLGTVEDNGGTVLAVRAGRQLKTSLQQGKIGVCPVASMAHQMPDGASFNTLKVGVAFGGTASTSPSLKIRPTGTASIARLGLNIENPGGPDISDSQIGMFLDLGVGFVFNKTMSIIPSLSLPIGFDGADESFNIAFSYGFGSRSASAQPRSR